MMAEDLNLGDRITGVFKHRRIAGVVTLIGPTLVTIRDADGAEFEVCPAFVDDLEVIAKGALKATTAAPAAQTTEKEARPPSVAPAPLSFPADSAPTPSLTAARAERPTGSAPLTANQEEADMYVKCEVCKNEFNRTANNQVRCAPCQQAYRKTVTRERHARRDVGPRICRHPGCNETPVGRRYLCPKHWAANLRKLKDESKTRRARGEYARQAARDAAKIALTPEEEAAKKAAAVAQLNAANSAGARVPAVGTPPAAVPPPALELLTCDRCGGYYRNGIDGDRTAALCLKCLHDQEKAAETAEAALATEHPLRIALLQIEKATVAARMRLLKYESAHAVVMSLLQEGVVL